MRTMGRRLLLTTAIIGLFATLSYGQKTEGVDQAELERAVLKKVLSLPYYGVFDHIAFKAQDGTVTLYGKVYNAVNRRHAERYVEDVEGVTKVVNNIDVLAPSSFDDRIRRRTVIAFYNGGSLYRYLQGPNPSVRIIVERGRLTLEGIVGNSGDVRLANILASGIPGVFEVTNNLKVENADL